MAKQAPGVAVQMQSYHPRIAISGGTGGEWGTQLGVKLAEALKTQGAAAPLYVESRLRMAAEAPK